MKILILILILSVWIYMLSIFKRKQMSAFYFITGTCGFFLVSFITFKGQIALASTRILEFLLEQLDLGFYQIHPQYHQIWLTNIDYSLFINYECSGMIEILVYIATILFFPRMKAIKRVIYLIAGTIYTIFANLIRLLLVMGIMNTYGSEYYHIAHSIIGRIAFYVLTVFLYFYVITFHQLKEQRTGRFGYDKEEKNDNN